MYPSKGHQHGFALLIVLWTLVLLSLLISAIAASGSGRTRQAADLRRNAQLREEADGGVEEAVFHLLDGSRGHWAADGAVHLIRRGDTTLSLRIDSEAGKINPNRASLELLAAFLQAAGVDSRQAVTIATNIVAWRFPTGQVALSQGGDRAGRDYLPPGAPFETIDELGLVQGITPRLLAVLAPHLSLYRDSDPDIQSADPIVLRAMQAVAGPGAGASPEPDQAGHAPDETVVTVTAGAADAAGHRFVRRAIILKGTPPGGNGGADGGNGGRPFQVMRWDAIAAAGR